VLDSCKSIVYQPLLQTICIEEFRMIDCLEGQVQALCAEPANNEKLSTSFQA